MTSERFFGREYQLNELTLLAKKQTASLAVIYGRRRVGKSRMLDYFGDRIEHNYYRFSGLAPTSKTTAQAQRDEFSLQLSEKLGMPEIKVDDWSKLFILLAQYTQSKSCVIVLDEISWMGSKDDNFLGKLKTAWDDHFKNNPSLMLVLCGSVSSWIEKNILSSTGFMGRLSTIIKLEEMSISTCNKLIESLNKHYSSYEKLKLLSVMGGIPRYLEEIQSGMTAEENIARLCFNKSGILFREFDDIFSDLFGKRSDIYINIILTLLTGSLDYNTICEKLKRKPSSHINECLVDLVSAGFVSRDYKWAIKSGKESKLSVYRLRDNYARFYLKYIAPNRGKIEQDHFRLNQMETLSGWSSIMGLQFENLVLNNRDFIISALGLRPEDIISDNPFFQRKTERMRGCQIDYLIQTRLNVLFVCEVKFSRNEIRSDVIDSMKEKLRRLSVPRGFSCQPVLIHVNGVSGAVIDNRFFYKIIDFCQALLSK